MGKAVFYEIPKLVRKVESQHTVSRYRLRPSNLTIAEWNNGIKNKQHY